MKTPKKSKQKVLVNDDDESFQAPKLSKKQRAQGDEAFKRARKEYQAKMTPEDKLMAKLLQIRFLLEDAIKSLDSELFPPKTPSSSPKKAKKQK
jgi:type III secretion system FlhB-like substrate exporter